MPVATSDENPVPSPQSTCTGRILAPGAAPDTPAPLLLSAAMVPLTCVPWPLGSVVPPSPSNELPPPLSWRKKCPLSTCPDRSGWFAITPVSTSATVTPSPCLASVFHAATYGTFVNAHCCLKSESFGFVNDAFTGLSTSTACRS